jgi:hypothetical protein
MLRPSLAAAMLLLRLPACLTYTVRVRPTLSAAFTAAVPRSVEPRAAVDVEFSLGKVASSKDGLLVIAPEARAEAKTGTLLSFAGGATGVILFERCGYYFASALSGGSPQPSEAVSLLDANLSIPLWREGSQWGGPCSAVFTELDSEPATAEALVAQGSSDGAVAVFGEPVPAAGRRPIGSSMHTGVIAIDALTPIGRGQSMALFGPNGLPSGAGRTDLAMRVIEAQHTLSSGVK